MINKTLPYNSVKDFEMISMIGTAGLIVVTHPDFPAKTVKEFIDVLKADPAKYNFATGGAGSTQHFGGELINQMVGVKMTHVPFRGSPAAMAALAGKQVDVLFELIQPVMSHVSAGTLKAIGVTSPERSPSVPNIPTFNETGLPGFDMTSWYGLALPAGTPAPIVKKMSEALAKALARPDVAEQIRKAGAIPKTSTPEELKAHIAKEIQKWSAVREKAGIPQNWPALLALDVPAGS